MERHLKLCVFVVFCMQGVLGQMFSFSPPATVRCEDDKDFKEEFCPKFKEKKFCETKVEIMELACAKTCELCPSEKFSKDVHDIIKDQKKVEKATGEDLEKTKEGLKNGEGSPTAGGDFNGNGTNEAEKEATEVPGKEAGDKPGNKEGGNDTAKGENNGGKGEKNGGEGEKTGGEGEKGEGEDKAKGQEENDADKEKGEGEGGDEPKLEDQEAGDVGTTSGCDKQCQKECVQAHNLYRANHGAPRLKWDQTLSDQAQAVADKNAAANKFAHSDWAAGKGGECIAWGPIKPSWLIAVKDWVDEQKDYDYNTGKSKNGKAVGHFTQVVWKKATKVGCGKSEMTMMGSKGPFYIAQMDVVGIVQDKSKELEYVGKPKKPDLKWFDALRDKQMAEQKKSPKRSHSRLGKVVAKAQLGTVIAKTKISRHGY